MCIDICPNNKRHNVEEWHPGLLGQELLRERKGQRGGYPTNFHNGPESGTDGRAYLMPGTRAGDDSHARKVNGVLDR